MGLLSRASLHPPAHDGDGGAADLANGPRPSWILLDLKAYVANEINSTTATCPFKGDKDKKIQVTFFPAHPPRVSYFCVFCSGLKSSAYALEPKIVATEANLVLLRIALGDRIDSFDPRSHDYFIYKADGGGPNGKPLLEQLPHPHPYIFHDEQVGLLSYNTGYTVVALRDDSSALYRKSPAGPGHYEVCILESQDKDKGWIIKDVSVPPEQQQQQSDECKFRHATYKTITIGGRRGTMAFVDLWRGILQYDVLGGSPLLRYTLLPEICPGRKLYKVNPLSTRDIALVEGRIKYVEMVKAEMITGSAGWKAVTWSMPVSSTSKLEDRWLPPCELEACNIHDEGNLVCSELLPKLNCKEGEPKPTFASLDTDYPILSLCDDDIVYFMTKVAPVDTKACMIAVDMKSRKLERLAEFSAERMLDTAFACMHSRISSYLKMAPGMRKTKKEKGVKILEFGGLPAGRRF